MKNLKDGIFPIWNLQGEEVQNKYIKKALTEKGRKIYAIADTGGIIVVSGKVIFLGNIQTFSR